MGKHSIRGVLSGEEMDVRGTYSKRLKSHDAPYPKKSYNVVFVNGTWFRSAPNFRQQVNDQKSWSSNVLAAIEREMLAVNVGLPRVMVSVPSYNQLRQANNVVSLHGRRHA